MTDLTTPLPPVKSSSKVLPALLIGAFVLIALGAAGWFGGSMYATGVLKDRIDDYLADVGITDKVTYGELSATPLGDFVIKDIRYDMGEEFSNTVMSADQMTGTYSVVSEGEQTEYSITGILYAMEGDKGYIGTPTKEIYGVFLDRGDGISSRSEFTLVDLEFPFLEVINREAHLSAQEQQEIKDVGLEHLTINMEYFADYSLDTQDFSYLVDMSVDGLGRVKLVGDFDNFDMSELKAWQTQLRAASPDEYEAISQVFVPRLVADAERSSLVSLSLLVDTAGAYERLNFNDNPTFAHERDQIVRLLTPVPLILAGQTPEEAERSIALIKEWLMDGGVIELKTNASKPLPLTMMQREGGVMEFLEKTNFSFDRPQ